MTGKQAAVLALIACNEPHEFDAAELARILYGQFTHPAGATATASSLVRHGLLERIGADRRRGGPPLPVRYRITPAGRAAQ